MRDYSKVSGAFWTGKTGKALRGDMQAQIIALYLMTSPHSNMIGVYVCPAVYIAHETGSSWEGAMEGLNRLCEGGFCTYDEDLETVWVHEMAKFQIGDELKPTDNRVKDIQKQYSNLPEGRIKTEFFNKYAVSFHLVESKPLVSPLQAPMKPEAGTGTGTEENTLVVSDADRPACPHEKIIALYHESLPTLPGVKVWNEKRRQALKARWLEDEKRQSLDFWKRFFEYVAQSDFLCGRAGTFQATLEWLVNSSNFVKVIEGNYENRKAA